MLLCIALNKFRTSQIGAQISVFHGHAQEERHVPVSNLKIDQTLFIRNPFSNSAIHRVIGDILLMIINIQIKYRPPLGMGLA